MERGYTVIQCYTPATRAIEILNDGRRAELHERAISTDVLGDVHLLVTASILERCTAVISVDSAIMHLAGAVKTPTVGIFVNKSWDADTQGGWSSPFLALRGDARYRDVLRSLDSLKL
jgi:ADP-heptose:LPS heptosyltransferase